MRKMFNLVQNENMKLFHSISTKIMMGILVLIVVGVGLIFKFTGNDSAKGDWKAELTIQNEMNIKSMEEADLPQMLKDSITKEIQTNEYRLKNDIPPIENKSLWSFVQGVTTPLISLIALFSIIMGGRIVANEFSEGTIKLLLIRPSKRWKILLAKYISVMGYTLLMLLVILVISFLVGGILFSFKGATVPFLINSNGVISEMSMVSHILQISGLGCVSLVMMVTLAFMISTIARNSGVAIGLGVFLLTTENIIILLLSRYSWFKYVLFANTNLNKYIDGKPIIEGMTMTFSIIMLIVYFIAFNGISYLAFTKRDIVA